MKMKMIIACVGLAMSVLSCNIGKPNWDIDVTAPMVETKLDLTNLIGQENLSIAEDSAISIAIDVPLYTFSFDTISNLNFAFSDYNYVWQYPTMSVPGGVPMPLQDATVKINNNNTKLTRFDLKEGKLRCNLKSTLSQRLIFKYYIPQITINGEMLSFIDTLPGTAQSSDTVSFLRELSISNYNIDLTGVDGDDFNTLTTFLEVSTVAGDPNVLLTNGQTLFKAESEIVEVTPKYAKGYLGAYNFNQISTTSNFNALEMVQSGLIDIENVSLNLIVHNTIGGDLSFKPFEIKATNSRTGETVFLNHSTIGTTININRALENSSTNNPVTETIYNFAINSGNSNIEQFMELLPNQLSLLADVELNAFGNTSGYTDFFFYDYPAYIQLQLNMPLKFSASNLLLIDTIANPFANLDILDPINGGEFIVRVENKFPIKSNLQLYTLNDAGAITDSIFTNSFIMASPVNSNNRITESVTTDLIIEASAEKIKQLKAAAKIQLKVYFNTSLSNFVRPQFYSDYYMIIKMIADVKYNIAL